MRGRTRHTRSSISLGMDKVGFHGILRRLGRLLKLETSKIGYHNVAETKYGTPEWNCHYSHLNGTGTAGEEPWGPDPQLTALGISQALAVNAAWKRELKAGAPLPEVLYSSPLRRSAATLELTWRDILIEPKGMRPIFKEMARETIGLHTCLYHFSCAE